MTPTTTDQIDALQDTISHTEAELETCIQRIKDIQWEARQHTDAAKDLYETCESTDNAAVKALQRRADNLHALTSTMTAVTQRF